MYSIPTTNLQHINDLYDAKKEELKELINDLKIADVKTDEAFKATTKRIKKKMMLSEVIFGEPKVTKLESGTRTVPGHYGNFLGGSQDVHEITVEFPFTGSAELFEYMPDREMIPAGVAYQPSGNKINVEVTLKEMNKEKAISEAKSEMESTFAIIKGNNVQGGDWWQRNESFVDSALIKRRDELIAFFK